MSSPIELVIETALRLRNVPGLDLSRLCILLEDAEMKFVTASLLPFSNTDAMLVPLDPAVPAVTADLMVSGLTVRKR